VQLFKGWSRSVEWRLGNFLNSQALSNTAWAFAQAAQLDAQLFATLARAVGQCLGDFNSQAAENTAWALAKAAWSDVQLFEALARAAGWSPSNFYSQAPAKTACAFIDFWLQR